MNKRARKRQVRENRKKLFLEAWHEAKAEGVSLSSFCRDYGLCRNNFYRWLREKGEALKPYPIRRVDPALAAKAIRIHRRYHGTWSGETISLALRGRISPWSVRKAVRSLEPNVNVGNSRVSTPVSHSARRFPLWATDWTEFKIARSKFFILLLMDEASRFWLGHEILAHCPNSFDVARLLAQAFDRYSSRPLAVKSDRAQVFKSSPWLEELRKQKVLPRLSRPHCPTDQAVIERGIREVKQWLRVLAPENPEALRSALDEGIFMLNFLKPKVVLNGQTPAAAYFTPQKLQTEPEKRISPPTAPPLSRPRSV